MLNIEYAKQRPRISLSDCHGTRFSLLHVFGPTELALLLLLLAEIDDPLERRIPAKKEVFFSYMEHREEEGILSSIIAVRLNLREKSSLD